MGYISILYIESLGGQHVVGENRRTGADLGLEGIHSLAMYFLCSYFARMNCSMAEFELAGRL